MAVQLQWGLDSTVGSALSVARGIFLAANRDDIQPLAILSCERFGATVAMCQETCLKVETLTAKTPMPVAIRFLKGYAGFDPSDTAVQLSKSQAGIQFLSLAAALVTSMDSFDAATSLHLMLTSTTTDKTLLPTVNQLMALLAAVTPRLVRAGFMNSVIGWQIMWPRLGVNLHSVLLGEDEYPDSAAINGLVQAFRTISRIGEMDIRRVEIEAYSSIPWLIAFTKWCIGIPPSVHYPNGQVILEQPDSLVRIISAKNLSSSEIKISMIGTIESSIDLVGHSSGHELRGMVDLETFGRARLRKFCLDTPPDLKLLSEVLMHVLRTIVEQLCIRDEYRQSTAAGRIYQEPWLGRFNSSFAELRLSPFPEYDVIAHTASQYIGLPITPLEDTPNCSVMTGMPPINIYLNDLEELCECWDCHSPSLPHKKYEKCRKELFLDTLAIVCCDILALSLFDRLDSCQFLMHKRQESQDLIFRNAVRSFVFAEKSICADMLDIWILLNYAIDLTGQKPQPECLNSWIMSSGNGQVVFPTILETLAYEKKGFLRLTCLPGVLRYNDTVYNIVTTKEGRYTNTFSAMLPLKELIPAKVTIPRMLFPEASLIWVIQPGHRVLNAWLGLGGTDSSCTSVELSIDKILWTLSSALLVESCPHNRDAPLEDSDIACGYTTPLYPLPWTTKEGDGTEESDHEDASNSAEGSSYEEESMSTGAIGVVAVDGSDQMRFLTLANACPVVLRKDACIKCCLEVCKASNYRYLVL